MPKYYPLYLNIESGKSVVVGGGEVAYRKACGLKEAGSNVIVISPEFCDHFLKPDNLTLIKRKYAKGDIDGATIVIASTNDKETNKQVYTDASVRNIPVNIVDQPDLCSFIVPSVIRRGDLCISISTGGTGPALAKSIRLTLEEHFGPEYTDYTELLSSMRQVVLSTIIDGAKRRKILKRFADNEFIDMVKNNGKQAAENAMREIILSEK